MHTAQIAILDPTGARTRLLSKDNPDAARVGDVLLVRFKEPSSTSSTAKKPSSPAAKDATSISSPTNPSANESYAGVCLSIRRRGVDTGILLRNHFTRVGVEMWVKIYSPNVAGIEVVQRKEKRARRARLYYMRYVFFLTCCRGKEIAVVDGEGCTDTNDVGNRNMIVAIYRTW